MGDKLLISGVASLDLVARLSRASSSNRSLVTTDHHSKAKRSRTSLRIPILPHQGRCLRQLPLWEDDKDIFIIFLDGKITKTSSRHHYSALGVSFRIQLCLVGLIFCSFTWCWSHVIPCLEVSGALKVFQRVSQGIVEVSKEIIP